MANKRNFKRDVQYFVSNLFIEAAATCRKLARENPEQYAQLLNDILALAPEYRARANSYERANPKAYFKKVVAALDADASALMERINAQR